MRNKTGYSSGETKYKRCESFLIIVCSVVGWKMDLINLDRGISGTSYIASVPPF